MFNGHNDTISIEEVNEVIERIMDPFAVNEEVTSAKNKCFVKIVEQPAKCALRFRYECEGRSAGSIPGQNSSQDNKTYPTIQVVNYKGPAVVVVSCVTKDYPYRPHPHNLVGKEGCKKGVCTMVINNPDMLCSFTSLGIQCVKRKDIEESLKLREAIKVDPFRTGFAHKSQASNIDLNVVRLCFQVFVEGPEKDKFTVPLQPTVSDPIYDKKAMSDLVITKLSHCSAPVTGGKEIILLCDRVTKDDIQVRFFEEKNGQLIWEGFGDLQPNDVHKQVAISFRSPRYYNDNIQQPVHLNIQLRRPSDGQTSEARAFQFFPRETDSDGLVRKRQKVEEGCLNRYIPGPALSPLAMSSITENCSGASHLPSIPKEPIRIPRLSQNSVKVKLEATSHLHPSVSWTTTRNSSQMSNTHSSVQIPQPSSPNLQSGLKQPNSIMINQAMSNYEGVINIKSEADESLENVCETQSTLLNPLLMNSISNVNSVLNSASFANNANNNVVEGPLTEKMDSLDLDIDPNDLINDFNLNNMMIMMDSGNNITFNSSGNINVELPSVSGSLSTPQILDISDSSRNLISSPSQMSRLQSELIRMHANSSSSGEPQ
ncbi:embryonic polarity protein dorsal-like protein [Leptotrombidium deliense]|uniref:Embryonic polarity protein dorsal-like protein n=1 Tax=Leptotrombidium deliense TaxID=299467 RepID=A0A443SQR4_9ACAR|nr:embryonic polarity protein dorsal-like protein [Leptotrombidium deliense]